MPDLAGRKVAYLGYTGPIDSSGVGRIATVSGRYYAMDRDKRWDRIEKARLAMTDGVGEKAAEPVAPVKRSYERNVSDEQIKMIGARGGVIGINAVLVSPHKDEATLDRYIDHIEHVRDLIGISGVAIGFDFFEFIYRQWSPAEQIAFQNKFSYAHFVPELAKHSHSRGLTRRLIERRFKDDEIEAILFRNWMRIFEQWL